MNDEATAVTAATPKRKSLKKPTKSPLKKVKALKKKKVKKTKKVSARRPRVDLAKRYRVAKAVDETKIRSNILRVMVKAGKKLRVFDIERLNKSIGKHLPTKSRERQLSVVSWRVRHSGLFTAAA